MGRKIFTTTLGALAGVALLGTTALAVTPASPGQLVGNPQQYAGQEVSVTGWVSIRGNVGWVQLCDKAMSCIYLKDSRDYQGRPLRSLEGQRLTFVGRFQPLATVNHTDVQNVLVVQG